MLTLSTYLLIVDHATYCYLWTMLPMSKSNHPCCQEQPNLLSAMNVLEYIQPGVNSSIYSLPSKIVTSYFIEQYYYLFIYCMDEEIYSEQSILYSEYFSMLPQYNTESIRCSTYHCTYVRGYGYCWWNGALKQENFPASAFMLVPKSIRCHSPIALLLVIL